MLAQVLNVFNMLMIILTNRAHAEQFPLPVCGCRYFSHVQVVIDPTNGITSDLTDSGLETV